MNDSDSILTAHSTQTKIDYIRAKDLIHHHTRAFKFSYFHRTASSTIADWVDGQHLIGVLLGFDIILVF